MNELQSLVLIVLLACLVIGFRDWWLRRREDRRLRALDLAGVDQMSGPEFKSYIGRLLESQGFKRVKVIAHAGDFGVDLVAHKDGTKYAVQTKRQTAGVSRHAIADLRAGKVHHSCERGMVVTNSTFTNGARIVAEETKTELVDRRLLAAWIQRFQENQGEGP